VMTSVHRDGSRWTLDALSRDETRQLRDTTTPIAFEPAEPVPVGAGPLLAALVRDGRAPAADLARSLGRDPSTARRQLTRLLRSGAISLRCEVANSAVGYPISFLWLARVAAADVHRTVTALATLPELRLCASTTGATNLVIAVWARDLRQVETIEQTIGELAPWIEFVTAASTSEPRNASAGYSMTKAAPPGPSSLPALSRTSETRAVHSTDNRWQRPWARCVVHRPPMVKDRRAPA